MIHSTSKFWVYSYYQEEMLDAIFLNAHEISALPLRVKTFYWFCILISLNDLPKLSIWNTAHIEVSQQRSAYNRLEKVEFHSKWINFMKIFVAINLFSHTLFLQGFWVVLHLNLLVHLAPSELEAKTCFQRQSFTKYLRQNLDFMWNNTLREKFDFCFSRVFHQY